MVGSQDLPADPWRLLRRLAHDHLTAETAERWLRMARPAVHLLTPDDVDDGAAYDALPLVGRLGGLPAVAPDFAWPVWAGHGPLSLVAEVDLGTVTAAGLDPGIVLPRAGRLLAFYYDGTFLQDRHGIVLDDEPESMAGMRLLHLVDDPAARVAPQVPGLHIYPERPLRGRQATTHPHWADPALELEFREPGWDPERLADHRRWMRHPVNGEALREALDALRAPGVGPDDVHHQLGGWADGIQHPPETVVADDPLRWRPVLQVGSEPRMGFRSAERGPAYADDVLDFDPRGPWPGMPEIPVVADPEPDDEMTWDDLGALYWLARDDDLPGLTDVRFTRQSG